MTDKELKKRGRPKGYKYLNPLNKRIPPIPVTEEKLTAYKKAAKSKEMTFAAFAREALDKAVENI